MLLRSPVSSVQREDQQPQPRHYSDLADVRQAVQRQAQRLQLQGEHLSGEDTTRPPLDLNKQSLDGYTFFRASLTSSALELIFSLYNPFFR